jgi:hypothetical protein
MECWSTAPSPNCTRVASRDAEGRKICGPLGKLDKPLTSYSFPANLIAGRGARDHHQLIFQWNYALIPVPLKRAGVAKLADAPDLGSGGEILRGSSPLSGKYFIIRDLEYNVLWTLNALSQQMQPCVTMFELAFSDAKVSKI